MDQAATRDGIRICYVPLMAIGVLALQACGDSVSHQVRANDGNLTAAEEFVDAFYSYDAAKLRAVLSSAESSQPLILYYQGWAERGHYEVINRKPCKADDASKVSCSITVKDDLMSALGIDFDVTDTFHITLSDGKIVSVETSSDDLPVYSQAEEWVNQKHPDLFQESCRGYFEGGPTPGDCVRAMVRGFAEFAASEDFPKQPTSQ
jgi:hypothetical protein